MTEWISCEFRLIRYVPDVIRGEFINIGVALREVGPRLADYPEKDLPLTQVRITSDWSRVKGLDPDADIELLESLQRDLALDSEADGNGCETSHPFLEVLSDTLSHSIQITDLRFCLTRNFYLELDHLMKLHVESRTQDDCAQ